MNLASYEYPSLQKRVQAILIDEVLLIILYFITAAFTQESTFISDTVRGFLLFGPFFIYEPLCTAIWGTTIGQEISGIQIRQYRNPEKKINLLQAYVRFIFKIIFGIYSFFAIHFNSEKRAAHDFMAGTVVIETKKKGQYY